MLDHKYFIFFHLAKTPNTNRVAELLRLTQPAISKSIKELEKELSITLFDRIKGRLQLTPAGEYLLKETESFIQKEREVRFQLEQMKNCFTGTLDIGASTTLSQYVLPELLARFSTTTPAIRVHITSGNTYQIEKALQQGELHLAFTEGMPHQPDIHYIPFLQDEIVLVCSSRLPLPSALTKEEFVKLKFVWREKDSGTYHIIRKLLAEQNVSINQLHEQLVLGTTEGIKQYLHRSDCFALLSIYSVREELKNGMLKVIETPDLNFERLFYIIHKQGALDPYAQKFIDFIQREAKK